MIALGNFLISLGKVLGSVTYFFLIITFVRAIVSWVNADPHNPVVRFLIASTEPFLRPLRRYIPPLGGTFDISIFVFALLLVFIQAFVAESLVEYGVLVKLG